MYKKVDIAIELGRGGTHTGMGGARTGMGGAYPGMGGARTDSLDLAWMVISSPSLHEPQALSDLTSLVPAKTERSRPVEKYWRLSNQPHLIVRNRTTP